MFTNTLSNDQKEKIKQSNIRFKKMFKYSTSFVIAGVFIFLALILGFANSQGIAIGNMGMLIIAFSMGGILGANMKDNIRAFESDIDQEINEPESDFLSRFLKQSVYANFFKPEIFEKLTVLKLTKNEDLKNSLEQDVFALIDSGFENVEAANKTSVAKPLHTKEKQTLLIMAAAGFTEAKIDWSKPTSAAVLISKITTEMGAYLSESNITDKLKLIPDALESRAK
jgi:hypothetical protein